MTFESKRLCYETATKGHASELESILCDPQVYKDVDDGVAPTADELAESFQLREHGTPSHRQNERWIDYIVRIQNTGIAIGRIEATVIESRAEVAYFLGAPYWRQGYGSESLNWLECYLQKHYGVQEFWATVTPKNIASKRLLLSMEYIETSSDQSPLLTSYDQGDWIFHKPANQSYGKA